MSHEDRTLRSFELHFTHLTGYPSSLSPDSCLTRWNSRGARNPNLRFDTPRSFPKGPVLNSHRGSFSIFQDRRYGILRCIKPFSRQRLHQSIPFHSSMTSYTRKLGFVDHEDTLLFSGSVCPTLPVFRYVRLQPHHTDVRLLTVSNDRCGLRPCPFLLRGYPKSSSHRDDYGTGT